MPFQTLSAETIATWEKTVGPSPIHGLAVDLTHGWHVESHRHDRGQIMFAAAGAMTISVPHKSWVIGGCRALWVPESLEHEVRMSTNVEMRNLQISRACAPELPTTTCCVRVTPLLRELLLTAIAGPNYFCPGDKQERVVGLILDEFEEAEVPAMHLPDPRDARLVRVCNAMRDRPGDRSTLDEWADIACVSARTLARLFVQDTGLSFAVWRRQLRLINAIARLSCGDSVTTVALDAGYDTPSGFIEMFRRQTGCTPGQYLNH